MPLFASPVIAQEGGTQLSTDKAQIQLVATEAGARTEVKITVLADFAGSLFITVDDLVVYEGGFASATYGSQPSSLSDYLFIEASEFRYQPGDGASEFVVPISIRSGLPESRYARVLASFVPDDPESIQSLLPISVIAVTENQALPNNIVIEPASEIRSFKIKEDNSQTKFKKYIPAIPKIIDAKDLKLDSTLYYEDKNLSWGQVNYLFQGDYISIKPFDLPGIFLLPKQEQKLTTFSSAIESFDKEFPTVGLLKIDAYVIDPATGEALLSSKVSNWAILFPWKIPFVVLTLALLAIAIWYNFFRGSQVREPKIKATQEKVKPSPPEDISLDTFDTQLEFLIYLISKTGDEGEQAQSVAKAVSAKYKTPRSLARASDKSLKLLFAPSGLSGYKAEVAKELAKYLVDNFSGTIPSDPAELNLLPGVFGQDAARILERNW